MLDAVRDAGDGVVRAAFRPEFLNRLDEILLFHRLSRATTWAASSRSSSAGCGSCWRIARSIWTSTTRLWLGWPNAGYDPVYGARPLKRVIQRELQNPLATLLLEGRIADGQKVEISAGEQGLLIDGIPAGTQTPGAGTSGRTGSSWASQRTVH